MMEMVIVGTISYDDIETPSEKASSVLGGSATHSGLASRSTLGLHLGTLLG